MKHYTRSVALAFALGAATVLGYAPFYFYPLPFFSIAAIAVLLLRTQTTIAAGAIGFAFGLGLFVTGTSWVYVSLHDFGGMPMAIAAASTFAFCAIYASVPGIAAAAIRHVQLNDTLKLLMLFPAIWACSDWVRGWLFTGFPWLAFGYSQVPASPLAGYGPVIGVYGISLAIASVAACMALVFVRVSHNNGGLSQAQRSETTRLRVATFRVPAMIAVGVLVGGSGLATVQWTKPAGARPTRVALIQGNIPQALKWKPEQARETLLSYLELARASTAELIVLPETALPMFDVNLPPGYLEALGNHARQLGGDVLTGVPEYQGPSKFYNSVISLGTSPVQTYRKVHLVPFGDYVPLRSAFGWFMEMVNIPMSDFSRGATDQKPIAVAGQKVAVNICYEDVFGEEIIRQLPEATVLANFTNDAWWGKSFASRQHLQISQMRSLETGRYMLRATNTGVTAVIDQRGHVRAVAPEFETTVLNADVPGYTGTTPYVRWGNYAFLLIALALIIGSLIASRRHR